MRTQSHRESGGKQRATRARPAGRAIQQPTTMLSAPCLPRHCACGGGCPRCHHEAEPALSAKPDIGLPGGPLGPLGPGAPDQLRSAGSARGVRAVAVAKGDRSDESALHEHDDESLERAATPHGLAALAARTAAPAPPVPSALRVPIETRLGASLSAARLHRGPEVSAGLASLGAPAATLGRHVFLGSTAPPALVPRILAHELTHVAQTRQAEPDLRRPLRLGKRGSTLERQAATLSRAEPLLAADTNTLRRFEPSMSDPPWIEARAKAEAERIAALARWRPAVEARAPLELAAQPTSLAEAIEQSETALLFQRAAMFDAVRAQESAASELPGTTAPRPVIPADLLERWAYGEQAMITLAAAGGAAAVAVERQSLAQPVVTFYGALAPTLEAHEEQQRARETQELAEAERDDALRERLIRDLRRDPDGGRAAAASVAISPGPAPFRAPEARSPGVRDALDRMASASATADIAAAIADFAAATAAFDQMLMDRLGPAHEAAQAFAYQTGLLERQRGLAALQPHARPVPAVFYPELEYVDVAAADGTREQVARGIPWQLYLYHTQEVAGAGGEWVLEDLMAAERPSNRVPSGASETAMVHQCAVDPPWALFKELNSRLRFPIGRLEVQLPSGRRQSLETTEPITVSGFLTGLGISLAVLGFILFTGGAAGFAAAAFAGAALAGAGSTLAELREKSEQGLLTQREINQAMLFIAADIVSALAVGLGQVAEISTRAARIAGATSLLGRYVVPLQRAAMLGEIAGTSLDVTSAAVVTDELIHQARLIESSQLSEQEKRSAIARLVLTGLLTAAVTTVSMAGGPTGPGRRKDVEVDVDDNGRPLLRSADLDDDITEEAVPPGDLQEIRRRQQEIDVALQAGPAGIAAAAAPPSPAQVQGAVSRFVSGQPRPGDLAVILADAVADMRALVTEMRGGIGPEACAGLCGLAAQGVVPTGVLSLLENSRVRVQVDAMSSTRMGHIVGHRAGAPDAASHQFAIVRAGSEAYIVDPTFAQFLTPGSADVRQATDRLALAPGFLGTPEGSRLAHELVGKGFVPLTPANAALYARALALDLGTVGSVIPGPVANLLLSGEQHFSTLRFVSEAGSVHFVEPLPGEPGFPMTPEQFQGRREMIGGVERPREIIKQIENALTTNPNPVAPEAIAAQERLRRRLALLQELAERHSPSVGPWQ